MSVKRGEKNVMTPNSYHEFGVLSEVAINPEITQRQLSQRLGIALGLTNVLVRGLLHKGYMRVSQSTWKRRFYTLTPDGFTQKLKLLVNYISQFMVHYRTVRQSLRDELAPLGLNEESRIAICGTTEFAELVYLGLKELGIEQIEIFDNEEHSGRTFLGISVNDVTSLEWDDYDRVVLATLDNDDGYSSFDVNKVNPEKLVRLFSRRGKLL